MLPRYDVALPLMPSPCFPAALLVPNPVNGLVMKLPTTATPYVENKSNPSVAAVAEFSVFLLS